ncbi:MAG: hypothetical protein P8175_17715 [Deltaproteobacteria bacterium]|jgi:hypothetical protein
MDLNKALLSFGIKPKTETPNETREDTTPTEALHGNRSISTANCGEKLRTLADEATGASSPFECGYWCRDARARDDNIQAQNFNATPQYNPGKSTTICAHCAHLVDFETANPEHVTAQSFRRCEHLNAGRFPMQGACKDFSPK